MPPLAAIAPLPPLIPIPPIPSIGNTIVIEHSGPDYFSVAVPGKLTGQGHSVKGGFVLQFPGEPPIWIDVLDGYEEVH